jgi:hypothetical protein
MAVGTSYKDAVLSLPKLLKSRNAWVRNALVASIGPLHLTQIWHIWV